MYVRVYRMEEGERREGKKLKAFVKEKDRSRKAMTLQ